MEILTSKNGGILTIEFNRPDKKNAITAAMYQALADALKQAETDASVRAILFTGKPTIFTAGNDLDDFLNNPPNLEDSPVFQFLTALAQASKPMVAAVCGGAIGIGTTMLLHCDLVYAAENAKFALPFTSLGLCPEAASSLLLPQLAGYQRAAEKLLLGEPFLATEAHEMGLVNKVLPLDEVLPFATQQAAKLVALPAASIRLTRRLMRSPQAGAVQAQMDDEGRNFRAMLSKPEAKEAFTAFFEKRKPDFSQFG
jgi:enoyl-CoA hydratase/carnithine racemase